MMNQKQAAVSTLLAVLEERGVNYELNGKTPISEVLTDADRKTTRDTLFSMFRAGQIEGSAEFKSKMHDDKYLKDYVSGLVNNWIRKNKEFNNGQEYKAKNPGSRQGSGDQQIKEMKKLLSVTSDPTNKATIEAAIKARQEEIKPAQVSVDYSKIPDYLKEKLGL